MKYVRLLLSLGVCFGAAAFGSAATMPQIATWYAALQKPFFSPPNWIFGPVWTLLYAMMAVAAWLVWEKGWDKKGVKFALLAFGEQLALNVLWSFLFFAWHSLWGAYLGIIVLWALILLTIIRFRRLDQAAAWLLVPYILWVSFASFLNLAIALLN
ncbi:MAG: tryptophan-rich sensory protein [Candidatus Margulisbacteria bacterium]|jgi:tryptophan-rich sensory protein|nr:tryptophan-rich sensory protein [Candidatus Margulisiibacteriota bacterium]